MPDSEHRDSSSFESLLFGGTDPLCLALLRALPMGIVVKSPDGRYLWVNPAAERMLGHSPTVHAASVTPDHEPSSGMDDGHGGAARRVGNTDVPHERRLRPAWFPSPRPSPVGGESEARGAQPSNTASLRDSFTLPRLLGQTDRDEFPRSVSGCLLETDSTIAEPSSAIVEEIGLGPDDPDRLCAIQQVPIADADGRVQAVAMLLADRSAHHCELLQRCEDIGRLERENRDLRVLLNDLARLATTDKLTSAWNRRRLDEAVGDELHRLERYGHPVSLLLLDIDYFKRVNDVHGHAAGDAVLASLASLLRRSFRRSDSLTRWGGEEFVVLCPNTSLSMATLLAERLRKSIAVDSFPPVQRVTVSIGVAECIVGEEWQQWFDRADRALLRAKHEGRNRVSADPDTMSSEWVVNPATGRFLQLTWRSAYTSGHPLLDEQHRRLFEQSNRLLAAVLDNVPDHQIEAEFEALIQGVRDHFRDEEEILRRSGYPGVDDHALVHRELCNSACALLEKFRSGLLGVGELFEFLARDVVAKHLLGADRDFFGYVSGLAGTAGSRPAADRRR